MAADAKPFPWSRRRLLRAAYGGVAVLAGTRSARAADVAQPLEPALAAIERASGGRLGVAIVETDTGVRFGHRLDEHFPMCSTFKLLAAAAVLARVDAKTEQLSRRIRFERTDLVVGSPVTSERTGGDGMALAEICEAAITRSDNTAGNLLLQAIGGPAGLTRYARKLGDPATRLDRIEPELNEATPGDPRDTTTPAANLRALLTGDALSAASRQQLIEWLANNKTGGARLRAGLPREWRVGDKTGSGERGTANDVAVVWPPGRPPLVVAVYLTQATVASDGRDATIAAVGRLVAKLAG